MTLAVAEASEPRGFLRDRCPRAPVKVQAWSVGAGTSTKRAIVDFRYTKQNLFAHVCCFVQKGGPGRSVSRFLSDEPQFEYQDFPPFLLRSRRDINRRVRDVDGDDIATSPPLPEAKVAICKVARDDKLKTSESVIMDEISVASAKLEVNARKFVWVHLPYNNPAWVKVGVIQAHVSLEGQTLANNERRMFSRRSKSYTRGTSHLCIIVTFGRKDTHVGGTHSTLQSPGVIVLLRTDVCYIHPVGPLGLRLTEHSTVPPQSHSLMRPSIPVSPPDDGMYICLFLPYLYFDSYERLIRRRNLIFQRNCRAWARPIPEDVAKSESLELQMIWEFLGIDPPFNYRRTLGQYGYTSLRGTRSRDDDQMLYKLTKEQVYLPGQQRDLSGQRSSSQAGSLGSGNRRKEVTGKDGDQSSDDESHDCVLNGNVLMVDQLWLWTIGSR